MDVSDVLADLIAEQRSLDGIVAALTPEQWDRPTSSPGWTVTDQIAHLTYFDRAAATAIREPEVFATMAQDLFDAAVRSSDAADALTLDPVRKLAVPDRLVAWRSGRADLGSAAEGLADGDRVAWYGPSMSAKSFLTARLMEVWAHGQDVVDAVAATRDPTDRLRHIAQLGVITRTWSYQNRGLEAPPGDVRVDLTAPSGEAWTWNADATDGSVTGPAEEFCLVVTQRRHVDDTSLVVDGELARDWMERAQAFAGPATDGPAPGGRAS